MNKVLAYILTFFGLSLIHGLAYAQITNTGLPVSIAANTEVYLDADSAVFDGAVINDGTITSTGNFSVAANSYDGAGTIALPPTAQTLNMNGDTIQTLELSGGAKTLVSDLVVNNLDFVSPSTLATNNNELVHQAGLGNITGAGASSYVVGAMTVNAAQAFYPLALNGAYAPVNITDISGASPSLKVTPVAADPNAQIGRGVLAVASDKYWLVEDLAGTASDYIVELPLVAETLVADPAELTIAKGNAVGDFFAGTEPGTVTGTLDSGFVQTPANIQSNPQASTIYSIGRYFNEALKEADSAALVSIYNSTAGTEWPDSNNWLSDSLKNWSGITVVDKRVTQVELPSNNLQNTIPDITSGLENVVLIDLSDNELINIGALNSLSSLSSINVASNRLSFAPIENLLAILPGGVIYSPQKQLLDSIRTVQEIGVTYTLDRTIGGSSNTYEWAKDGTALTETGGTIPVTIDDFSSDGIYRAQVRNENVPGLVISTAPIILIVSSLERDQASLRIVYEALVTDDAQFSTDWLSTPITDWEEVTLENNRAIAIDLANKNLAGTLPLDITDVRSLQTVDLSGNEISGLENIMINPLETGTFNLEDNRLDPGDLVPVVDFPGIQYFNQKPIGSDFYIQIDRGEDYTVSFSDIDGANNTYNWTFNDVLISGANADTFQIQDINFNNMGVYQLEVRNTALNTNNEEYVQLSAPQEILAQTTLTMTPVFENPGGQTEALLDGEGQLELYLITEPGLPFEGVDTVIVQDRTGTFENVILGDYVVLSRPAAASIPKSFEGQDYELEVLPTYYADGQVGDIDWVGAETIELRDPFVDSTQLQQSPIELTPDDGSGQLEMLVETNFDEEGEEAARIERRRRARRAACFLSRRTRAGGGRIEQDEFTLIAYQETDDNGNVSFGNLPSGEYRINIQYPGVPMEDAEAVNFVIEEGEEGAKFSAGVTIEEGGISLNLEKILGIIRKYFKDLTIYPNPADKHFTLRYDKLYSENVQMRMISLSGSIAKEVMVEKGYDKEIEVDTREVKEGIYVLYFYDTNTRENVLSYKVIVTHK